MWESVARVVGRHLPKVALEHTAAQRYDSVELGADLDAFVGIGKHSQVEQRMLVFVVILKQKVDLHCHYELVQGNYRL